MFQEKALDVMKAGYNVFLTGSAGTGKTYVLNQYIEYLKDHKVPVAVTASTGIAATHMNGTTIHSWTGIGIKDSLSHGDLRSMMAKNYLRKHIEETHVLIIDEISMLHRNQLDMVNQVLKYIRRSAEPFGGMQVIFAGDFFQLPPVSREPEPSRDKFAFMSSAWQEASPVVCYLTEQYRQSKNSLNTILNELRAQEVTDDSIGLLQEARYQELSVEPTRLYTHNADVDTINKQKLEEIEGEEQVYFAEKKGNVKMLDAFVNSLLVQDKVELKKGARVMFLKNNHELGYMNGSLGLVVGFDQEDDWPIVQLSDRRKLVVKPEEWSIEDEKGKTLVSFEQVPLRLAWAITVHKSQGMTLEAAEVDLERSFEPGQGYVALSRLKEIEGLRLKGINRMALQVDPLAAKADARFMELSVEAEDRYPEVELQALFEDHILDSGGTTDPVELKKHRNKRKAKKEKKSTLDLTAELVAEGKDLQAIVKARGLSKATVIGHLQQLRRKDPSLDLEIYRPKEADILKVREALNKIREKGNAVLDEHGHPKLTLLHLKLGKKMSFEAIKHALLFVDEKP